MGYTGSLDVEYAETKDDCFWVAYALCDRAAGHNVISDDCLILFSLRKNSP